MTKTKHKKITGFIPVPAKALGQAAGHQNLIFLKTVKGYGEVQAKININNMGPRYQIRDDVSVIELSTGENLCIALSMKDLEDRLYHSPVGDIDLCDVTGSEMDGKVRTSLLDIGDKVYNKDNICTGVYIGTTRYTDKNGLKQIFDLYAAPEDLTDKNGHKLVATFNNSVKVLNRKKNWHGHHGEAFDCGDKLEHALVNGTYQGGWMVPTSGIVIRNLYRYKDVGALRGAFTNVKSGSGACDWYWSCTKKCSSLRFNVRFSDGKVVSDKGESCSLFTRPIRAVLRPS